MGFVLRSRFNENSETEVASLFHTNRENKMSNKNNLDYLKIDVKSFTIRILLKLRF